MDGFLRLKNSMEQVGAFFLFIYNYPSSFTLRLLCITHERGGKRYESEVSTSTHFTLMYRHVQATRNSPHYTALKTNNNNNEADNLPL